MAKSPYDLKINIDISGIEGALQGLEKALKKRVHVGVLNAETYDNGVTTAEVASWNEGNGTFNVNTPQRSVIGLPLELYRKEVIESGIDVLKKNGLTKESVNEALDSIGETAKDAIITAFDNSAGGRWAKNAQSTLRRKQGNKPMIDTGTLASNIEWEVVDG